MNKIKEVIPNSLVTIILCSILIAYCTPLKSTSGSSADTQRKEKYDSSIDLTTHLQKISGVSVYGEGANAVFRIRGQVNSIQGSNEPLFVVNESPQANGYPFVYNTVDVANIISIKVLKGSEAARYGSRGTNGVIIIDTTL